MIARLFAVCIAGFASGLPLALTGGTLQAWMASEKINLTVIGFFSLVGLPYTLKFLWAPLIDRFVPPFLGRRRGWSLITQLALFVAICSLGLSHPATHPEITAALALLVAFTSASQDIVLDAFRTELVSEAERGPAASLYIFGYRIGMIVSGSVALILADHFSWQVVYFIMAALMGIGILNTLLTPEPRVQATAPKNLKEAVFEPFKEFLSRGGAGLLLLFILIYKLDAVLTQAMMTPFLLEQGFTKTDIGAVSKGLGVFAVTLGALVGGGLMPKLGQFKSLLIFGLFQGFAGLSFMALAHFGHSYPWMITAIVMEYFCSGLGTAAFAAFLMSLCNPRFTATQYALLSSITAVGRVLAGAPSGYFAKAFGWQSYFALCTVIMIPGLVVLNLLRRFSLFGAVPKSVYDGK